MLNAIEHLEGVRAKFDWIQTNVVQNEESIAHRLLASIVAEGLFFAGSFASIFWLRSRNLLNGLSTANQLISRDENIHVEFSIMLYQKLVKRLDTRTVHKMFKDAVKAEEKFITESLPCHMIGMNADLMKQYIQYVADYLLKKLDYLPIYNVENPFPFVEISAVDNKTNFFEQRVTEYAKADIKIDELENLQILEDLDF